jgi:hypothetical protein
MQSYWRDTLNFLIARDPDPGACRAAVDVTTAWMIGRPYPVGRAGIAEALYVLLARVAAANPGDLDWFVRQLLIVAQLRYMAPAGLREDAWLDGASANLAGLIGVMEAAPADSPLRRLVAEGIAGLVEELPSVSMPTESSYGRRAGLLGRYAYLLNRAGLRRWRQTASVALRACELDASSGDPPLGAIVLALHWLGEIPDRKVAARAGALASRLGLSEWIARIDGPAQPAEVSLAALRASESPYGKGRLALELWRQESVTLVDLAEALPATPSSGNRSQPPPTLLSDLAVEALARATAALPVDWAPAAIGRLSRGRAKSRQQDANFVEMTMQGWRWRRLAELGHTELLHNELTAAWTAALPRKAVNRLLLCCSCAAPIDPALAIEWWRMVVPLLAPEDLGAAAATVAVAFAKSAPDLLGELTQVQVSPEHALGVCRKWVMCPALSVPAAHVMRGVLDRLDPAVAAAGKDAQGKVLADHLWLAAAVPDDDEPLSAIASDLAAKVLRWWQANAELAIPILENSNYELTPVAGSGSDAIARILTHVLDAHNSSDEGVSKMDRKAIMHAATQLKEIVPALSRRGFETVQRDWIGMLDPEYGNNTGFAGLLAQILSNFEKDFSSPHERTLYESTVILTTWCSQPPGSRAELAELQEAVGRVASRDLRALLLAPVATAWLRLGDHSLARAAAEQSSLAALHKAGYLKNLRSPGVSRDHIITLITTDTGHSPGEAIGDLLLAWFRLRLAESDPLDYFSGIERWIAANCP